MKLRPCIDIHDGKVKQIVGSSLRDKGGALLENFVSERDALFFAERFSEQGLSGGHIILLNAKGTPGFEASRAEAMRVLKSFPGCWQLGGGVNEENAGDYLEAGASHVIVTSYIFHDGLLDVERLESLSRRIGKEHLVPDLSCKKKEGAYMVATDRWQKLTRTKVEPALLNSLSSYCDEFLIHGADAEGKREGAEEELVRLLSSPECGGLPITYAGGIRGKEDLKRFYRLGGGRLDCTVGSALSLFGGELSLEEALSAIRDMEASAP